MRFLIRVAVLALAALGAKALYDKLAPRREELTRAATDFVTRTSSVGRDVKDTASEAAGNVVSVAHEGAASVAQAAANGADEVKSAGADARAAVADALDSEPADASTSKGT